MTQRLPHRRVAPPSGHAAARCPDETCVQREEEAGWVRWSRTGRWAVFVAVVLLATAFVVWKNVGQRAGAGPSMSQETSIIAITYGRSAAPILPPRSGRDAVVAPPDPSHHGPLSGGARPAHAANSGHAIDALAQGRLAEAAARYQELADRQPEDRALGVAAEVLFRRAAQREGAR